jgi:hypothetical protein
LQKKISQKEIHQYGTTWREMFQMSEDQASIKTGFCERAERKTANKVA